MKLRNSNVLVFGGSSGIGKAVTKKLIASGATVMITGRSEEKVEEVQRQICSSKLYGCTFDICNTKKHLDFLSMRKNNGQIGCICKFGGILSVE